MDRKDIIGSRFGKLTVLKKADRPEHKKRNDYWLCHCDIGKETV